MKPNIYNLELTKSSKGILKGSKKQGWESESLQKMNYHFRSGGIGVITGIYKPISIQSNGI